ncbi:MAG: DUF4364 family protein [Oscillospiraceae bacterium]|jgi:predicted transcriptional regulator|nr:DUF4364 family protein [Oscillospiraceae bacterium]
MRNDAFTAGVGFGGLRKKDDIKLLICYLFANTRFSITKDDVTKVLQENDLANYFEVNSAFSELIESEHIKNDENKESGFLITKSGEMISKELEVSLPISIREKAVTATLNLMAKIKRESENKVKIQKIENGYKVILEISDRTTDLLSVSMYAPDLMQADLVKKNFHKDPELFYECFLALVTRDIGAVKKILIK